VGPTFFCARCVLRTERVVVVLRGGRQVPADERRQIEVPVRDGLDPALSRPTGRVTRS
jgi:hypothetical protein